MGFGSYDESEQERQAVDAEFDEDDAAINERENEHEGSVEFETGASNDELLDRLQDIKDAE